MSPSSRKRRARNDDDNDDDDEENEELRRNVIAPTPRRKIAKNDDDDKGDDETETTTTLKTPPTVPAAASRNGAYRAVAAVIPEDTTCTVDEGVDVDAAGAAVAAVAAGAVTPAHAGQYKEKQERRKLKNPNARRVLRLGNNESPPLPGEVAPPVTPSHPHPNNSNSTTVITKTVTPPPPGEGNGEKAAKRRLIFGKLVDEIVLQPNTKRVYALIKKLTGSLGGNGSCGPIYGELTKGSMQKMVNLMKQYAQLNRQSRFLDVGSGIGKPNLHVAQDPGVAFSCGIEMELDRYRLGLKCLQSVLHEAMKDSTTLRATATKTTTSDTDDNRVHYNCMFLHGNIMQARTFDPFTHVYMFSIGFPPKLWVYLSEAWNRSKSPYMICFHGPRTIINDYEFDVELLAQMPTSMHASGEGHTGYIYQRTGLSQTDIDSYIANNDDASSCDKVFQQAYQQVQSGLTSLLQVVDQTVAENWTSRGRSMTRSEARKHGIVLSKE